ncbi:MAG: DUF4430 domain-containing protein [Candidatus Nomurabacteria bacterium]
MKKNRKKIFIVIIFLVLFAIILLSYFSLLRKKEAKEFKKEISPIVVNGVENNNLETKNKIEIKYEVKQVADNSDLNKIKVSLEVLGKTYNTEIKKNSSVFDAMKILEEENLKDDTFSFKYTKHLGLGAFINEINGVKGVPGNYWIYYVDNKKASVGVSNYILKAGDIISWKQESF